MNATKKEAQAALNAARTKAQKASIDLSDAMNKQGGALYHPDADAAYLYFKRCVAELEEAINEYARFDNSSDDET